ncbi:cupin domain-containing protein [Thalassiella azotivora]
MNESTNRTGADPGRGPRHGGVHDVRALAEELERQAAGASAGRAARTVVTVGGLRVTAIALAPGAELSDHESPGAATLHVLRGACTLRWDDQSVETAAGHLVQIPDARHGLTTAHGCVVLLTVGLGHTPPGADQPSSPAGRTG